MAVGAHHVGEHLSIAGVGLGPTRRVAVPVARGRLVLGERLDDKEPTNV